MTPGLATVGLLIALWWAYTRKGALMALLVLVVGVLMLGSFVAPVRDFGLAALNLLDAVIDAIQSALRGNWRP